MVPSSPISQAALLRLPLAHAPVDGMVVGVLGHRGAFKELMTMR